MAFAEHNAFRGAGSALYLAAVHGSDLHLGPEVSVHEQPEVTPLAHDEACRSPGAAVDLHLALPTLPPLPVGIEGVQGPLTRPQRLLVLLARHRLRLWRHAGQCWLVVVLLPQRRL